MTKDVSMDQSYQRICHHLGSVLTYLDELMENPIFITNIHGEQEIAIEQAAELFETLIDRFSPQEEQGEPVRDSELYDAT